MLSSTVGGLLLAGTASTTMRTIFPPPPLSWGLGKKTKKRDSSTPTDQTNIDHRASPFHRKMTKIKLSQTLVFNPGGYSSRLHDCPFMVGRRALLGGGSVWDAEMMLGARARFC